MNPRAKKIIHAMALGDGYVTPRKELRVVHSPKQEEYVRFKANLLSEASDKEVKVFHRKVRTTTSNYEQVGFIFYHAYLRFVRKRLYPNGQKTFTYKTLRPLTDEGVALWIMDDGSLYVKKRAGAVHAAEFVLCTYCSLEEADLVRQFFKERYGVNMTLKKNRGAYSLRCGTKAARILLPRLAKYACESMRYKFILPI